MDRRGYLAGVTIGVSSLAGCLNFTGKIKSDTRSAGGEDVGRNVPVFETDNDAPGTLILLRQQPQNPNGIFVGDSFEIGAVLGNAGGEPVTGEVSVALNPPKDDEPIQTAPIVVDELHSGSANMFIASPFEAIAAGNWELTAGPGIAHVYPEYDGKVTIENQPDQ